MSNVVLDKSLLQGLYNNKKRFIKGEKYIEEWKASVNFRSLPTEYIFNKFMQEDGEEDKKLSQAEARAQSYDIIAQAVVDNEGSLLFDTPEMIAWLKDEPASVFNALFEGAMEYSGLTTKAEEQIEKNSEVAEL